MRRTEIKTYDGLASFESLSHSSGSLHDVAVAPGSCIVVAEALTKVLVPVVVGDAAVVDAGHGTWPRLGPQSGSVGQGV